MIPIAVSLIPMQWRETNVRAIGVYNCGMLSLDQQRYQTYLFVSNFSFHVRDKINSGRQSV